MWLKKHILIVNKINRYSTSIYYDNKKTSIKIINNEFDKITPFS